MASSGLKTSASSCFIFSTSFTAPSGESSVNEKRNYDKIYTCMHDMCVTKHNTCIQQFYSLSKMNKQQTVNSATLLYCGTFILCVVEGQGVRFTDGPGVLGWVQTPNTDRGPYHVLVGVGVYLDVTVVIWWTSYKMDIQTTLPHASNHFFTINNKYMVNF